MKTEQNSKTVRAMVESAIMVALAVVLGLFKLFEMPFGGSITFASMLPIALISYRHGLLYGFGAGLCQGVIETLLGLNTVSYVTGWASVLAVILLDYVLAFAMMGIAGIFRGKLGSQSGELTLGCLLGAFLRYVCHVISGATVWAGLSIPTSAVLIGSIGYNATYMLPETVVLMLVALYLSEMLDFTKPVPTRIRRMDNGRDRVPFVLSAVSALFLLVALVFDVGSIFSGLQGEGGFDVSAIGSVDWTLVFGITAAALAVSTVLLFVALSRVLTAKRGESDSAAE